MTTANDQTLLITGSAGFIGTNFVRMILATTEWKIISLDQLTYAGNRNNLVGLNKTGNHLFIHGDIGDSDLTSKLLKKYRPAAIINFAAESHVDRSIHSPEPFIQTNIVGTFRLLESTRSYLDALENNEKQAFRFMHISTDEVYGSLGLLDQAFLETSPFAPNSPYSASKAASDHIVRAYQHTFGVPVLITHCTNNYGPYQFPEKLIPLMIQNALAGRPLPIYGDGQNIRDWLFVGDHCSALQRVLAHGKVGETYNIGGENELSNIEVVQALCAILDRKKPQSSGKSYRELITFVKDRVGHDRRYAINAHKIKTELNWLAKETFLTGLEKTVDWYLENQSWVENITTGDHNDGIKTDYSVGIGESA